MNDFGWRQRQPGKQPDEQSRKRELGPRAHHQVDSQERGQKGENAVPKAGEGQVLRLSGVASYLVWPVTRCGPSPGVVFASRRLDVRTRQGSV